MNSLTDEPKIIVTLTLEFRQGKDPSLQDLQNLTFNDAIFPDGTARKDITFAELQDQVWAYENKNNVSLTDENKT